MADAPDLSAWENVDRDEAIRQVEHFHAENLRNLRAVESLRAEVERLRAERDKAREACVNYARGNIKRAGEIGRLRDRIRDAKKSLADIEAVLKTMRDSGALSLAEWFSIEGMVRFTRTHLLDMSDDQEDEDG